MSQYDQDLQQEQQLLRHYREHSRGEPSAAVDALILAAARQAVEPPRSNWSQHLHAWLFGVGSRTRWSMAVAGLAVFGIGLDLALNTREQLPEPYDAPVPLASAPAPAGKPSAEREYKKAKQAAQPFAGAMAPEAADPASPPAAAAPQQKAPARLTAEDMAAAADTAVASSSEARNEAHRVARAKAEAEIKAKMQAQSQVEQAGKARQALAEEAPPLEMRLRQVLHLRREGKQAEADRLLAALKQEYPQRDLDAELQRLQGEAEKSGSSH